MEFSFCGISGSCAGFLPFLSRTEASVPEDMGAAAYPSSPSGTAKPDQEEACLNVLGNSLFSFKHLSLENGLIGCKWPQ